MYPSGFHLVSVHLFAGMDYALCLRSIIEKSKLNYQVYLLATISNTYPAKVFFGQSTYSCLLTNKLTKRGKKENADESKVYIFLVVPLAKKSLK